jgi:hypothetical protein
MKMITATSPREEELAPHEDDSLADLIKTITPEEASALWHTYVRLHPRLADLV